MKLNRGFVGIGVWVIIILLLTIVAGGAYYIGRHSGSRENAQAGQGVMVSAFDPQNSSFVIDGEVVTLVNGVAEREAAPGSASKIVTRYFGNTATGDLTGDGKDDIAFLVSQNTGGTGEFYYVVVAVQTNTGYTTTNAFFVGDRIAPQSTEIHSDSRELHVNYAERKLGEPMTAQPSQGAVLLLKVTPDNNLEGLMK